MKIKNKLRTLEINPDLVLGFSTMCDPFKSNTYGLVITMDNGRQETVTFFDISDFRSCVQELTLALAEVRKYKKVINGHPQIDYATRTRLKSVGHLQ